MARLEYRDDSGRSMLWIVIGLLILVVIVLTIAAKLFILAGIIAIVIGIFGIIYGLHEEEIVPVIYGTIYVVVGLCAIFFGTWLGGFLDSSGATVFLQDIFNLPRSTPN